MLVVLPTICRTHRASLVIIMFLHCCTYDAGGKGQRRSIWKNYYLDHSIIIKKYYVTRLLGHRKSVMKFNRLKIKEDMISGGANKKLYVVNIEERAVSSLYDWNVQEWHRISNAHRYIAVSKWNQTGIPWALSEYRELYDLLLATAFLRLVQSWSSCFAWRSCGSGLCDDCFTPGGVNVDFSIKFSCLNFCRRFLLFINAEWILASPGENLFQPLFIFVNV